MLRPAGTGGDALSMNTEHDRLGKNALAQFTKTSKSLDAKMS